MARQLRQRCRRPAEADVQQLDERVLLNGGEFHQCDPSSTFRMSAEQMVAIDRLVDEPARASRVNHVLRRALDIGGDDDHARGRVELAELGQDVQAVHPFHHQIEHHDVRLLDEVLLERDHAVLGLDDVEIVRFENGPHAPSRQTGIVHEQQFAFHTCSRMASAISIQSHRSIAQSGLHDRTRHAVDDARLLGFGQNPARPWP